MQGIPWVKNQVPFCKEFPGKQNFVFLLVIGETFSDFHTIFTLIFFSVCIELRKNRSTDQWSSGEEA